MKSEFSSQKMIDSINAVNGIDGILSMGKLKIDTVDTKNSDGVRICRLTATLHLNIMNPECYAFCRQAFEKNVDISVEMASDSKSDICQAYLVKELPERYCDNEERNKLARDLPVIIFTKTLDRELQRIKQASLEQENKKPFEANDNAKSNFIKRIFSNMMDYGNAP